MKLLRLHPVFLLLLLLNLITTSCETEKTSLDANAKLEKEEVQPLNPFFTLMLNSTDGLIFTAKSDDGGDLEFFGDRDDTGLPLTINSVFVPKASCDTTHFYLDSVGRIKFYSVGNSFQCDFNWISNEVATINVKIKDGLNTVTIVDKIDISSTISNKTGKNDSAAEQVKATRLGLKSTFSYNAFEGLSKKNAASATNSFNCMVDVKNCGDPANENGVLVNVDKLAGGSLGRFPATFIEQGRYGANIPSNIGAILSPCDVYIKASKALKSPCSIVDVLGSKLLDVQIYGALAKAGLLSKLKPKLAAALVVGAAAAVTLCKITKIFIDFPADDCQKYGGVFREFEDMRIYASIPGLAVGSKIAGPAVEFVGDRPFTNVGLSLSIGDQPKINKIQISPPSPGQGEDYTATATMSCLPAGSKVEISISGSDGYTDSKTFEIELNSGGEFSIEVPGAESGVQDNISFIIKIPGKSSITGTASIVFSN